MAPDSVPALSAGTAARVAAALAILVGLVLLSQVNYLFFHSVVEVAGIAVAFAIFLLVWNSRRVVPDSFFLLVGIAFLFIGTIDLVHTLAYKGMGILPGDSADLPTQLWLAARYFQSVAFLAATFLIGRTLTRDRRLDLAVFGIACAGAAGLLLASIFAWDVFPSAFVEGSGLTPFKVASEYVISLVMLATIGVLVRRRDRFDRTVFLYLVAAMALLIAGELAFTSYASVYGPANMFGHLFRLASVYCFYQAIVVVGLTRPTDLLFRELTAREEMLGRSERRYRSLVEYSPDAIFVNRNDRVDYINPAGLEIFGASDPETMIGRRVYDLFAPAYREFVAGRIRELRAGSPVPLVDEQIVCLDGTVRDAEVAAFPFEDEAGPAIEVVLRDVTDRKEAERRLRESEADSRSFMENLVDACAICEGVPDAGDGPVDIRLVDVNPALCRELGLPAEEIVGRTACEILPELAPAWLDRFLEVLRSRRAVEVEEPLPVLDRLYRVVGFPVRGGRVAVLLRDITVSRRAEEALRESEERYRSLVENSIDAVLLTTPGGAILGANVEACRIFGMTEEELMRAGRDAIVDWTDPRVGPALEERLRTGRFRGELRYRRKDGTVFPGEVATALFTDRDGTVKTTMIIRDVTDREAAEASLREYSDRLRASNEELQRFAYVASHDLQAPLRSIVSFSQLLERRYMGQLDADADEFIAFIVEGGVRMQALINDLLQVSRVETQAKEPVPTDAGAVVAGALAVLDPSLKEAGAAVTVGELPAVMADAAQLEQVFVNLIGNAIKYRREGVPPAIAVSACRLDGTIEFSVSDNGIGIEEEYFERIFEMFRRLHTQEEYEGTGIGLAIVKRIVDRHGGTIRVESTPGEGSTFYLTLPAA